MNLGKIATALEELDNSDDMPEFSDEEYNTIDEIREIRNYWCHQYYLDFIYIENHYDREIVFQKVAKKLHCGSMDFPAGKGVPCQIGKGCHV